MPRGWKTEDGPRPEFARLYGAREHASDQYAVRRKANVRDSQATILFGDPRSRGSVGLLKDAALLKRNVFSVPHYHRWNPALVLEMFLRVDVLNVAGNRESASPGIGDWVERWLIRAFDLRSKGAPFLPGDLVTTMACTPTIPPDRARVRVVE